MGISTVAVYSEADRDALHVALADQSCCIGRPEAGDSYLKENQIISAGTADRRPSVRNRRTLWAVNARKERCCLKMI